MQSFPRFLNDPRRLGAVMGIGFVILAIISGPILQGDVPKANDSPAVIRAYWDQEGSRYLAGDFLFGIAAVLLFIPFVVALQRVFAAADRSGGMWSLMMVVGAAVAVILGGAGAAPAGALAFLGTSGMDDSTVVFATRANGYSLLGLALGFALMLIPAAVVIAQTGVVWRWLAPVTLLLAAANIVGTLWFAVGDQEGIYSAVALLGLMGTQAWILGVSLALLSTGREIAKQPAQQVGQT